MYAHSANQEGARHALVDHLQGTARRARIFGETFDAGDLAYYVGLWHDIGKFTPGFQDYLLRCESDQPGPRRGPDHKAAGARLAMEFLAPLGLLIQGHHGGLKNRTELNSWLFQRSKDSAVAEATERARDAMAVEPTTTLTPPTHTTRDPKAVELFLRMLFSTLVDADFLDTEEHFSRERSNRRGAEATLQQLWARFEGNHAKLIAQVVDSDSPVNRVRHEVYEACLEAADRSPGMFRLTVPTGGGKTRSAMGFALRHAIRNGQQRVIVAVPRISITEQTAQVYRGIFQTSEDASVVLEHHSGGLLTDDDEETDGDFRTGQVWSRLAAENWDAPIVVTTTVQLFESLFSNMPGRTRRLHRLAGSVIILDEAQMLPPHLLTPVLDILKDLCEHYGTTIVLSTATQPAFEAIDVFAGLGPVEIVPDSSRHFDALARVSYEWRTGSATPWEQVADLMREESQALAILNTKKDTLALLGALDDEDALHLSTMLCGAHRRQVIEDVRARLREGRPCRLVSTQVVEAGVDIDFPLVLRAMAPLDSIIQSAGRCNREGLSAKGRVVVFRPEENRLPAGSYRIGTGVTEAMLEAGPIDMDDPDVPRHYFRRLFQTMDTDREGIQELREQLDYPAVAGRFKMIDEDTVSAVVTKYGTESQRHQVLATLDELRDGTPGTRALLRRLQPHMVSIYRSKIDSMQQSGLVQEVIPGLYQWTGDYHDVRGVGGVTSLDPDDLLV